MLIKRGKSALLHWQDQFYVYPLWEHEALEEGSLHWEQEQPCGLGNDWNSAELSAWPALPQVSCVALSRSHFFGVSAQYCQRCKKKKFQSQKKKPSDIPFLNNSCLHACFSCVLIALRLLNAKNGKYYGVYVCALRSSPMGRALVCAAMLGSCFLRLNCIFLNEIFGYEIWYKCSVKHCFIVLYWWERHAVEDSVSVYGIWTEN